MTDTTTHARELLEAATPLPWSFMMTGSEGGSIMPPITIRGRVARVADRSFDEDQANGALIVTAVNAYPALLDVAEALERLVDASQNITVDIEELSPLSSSAWQRDSM